MAEEAAATGPGGDKLILRGLQFHGYHGVLKEEQTLGQKFVVDIDAWMELAAAGESDCIADTVSYTDIYGRVVGNSMVDGEDILFCTLCDAEVRKFSIHCRSCDKCVDGFDHHCRLATEIGVGINVLVICFANKNSERNIQDRLGNGLPRPAFATIVAFFTLLSLVACIPLGELFFFHVILIRKVCHSIHQVQQESLKRGLQGSEDMRNSEATMG